MKIVDVPFEVDTEFGPLPLRLRHCTADGALAKGKKSRAVMILHGGNSSSLTFLLPGGGLVGHLIECGWDVWLLDYRASPYLQNQLSGMPVLGGSADKECTLFTVDRVVEIDIPQALGIVRSHIGGAELSVLGHCVGGGAVAMAIARGNLAGVRNIVLSTLGLFYEVPWNGWMKVEDYLIERILSSDKSCRGINPKRIDLWPKVMKDAYGDWPKAWLPYGHADPRGLEQMLSALTFMFGQPFFIDHIDPTLRDGVELLPVFGAMHLGLYWHLGQMVRRGYAARFNSADVIHSPDAIDRSRLRRSQVRQGRDPGPVDGYLSSGPRFKDKVVTLVAAAENRLWHRDSIDLMHEWLLQNASGGDGAVFKQVYPGYGLQELVWGTNANKDIYPNIEKGLRGREP
jgi:pimeloyl-ACP methyl ester carboxylesterase